MRSGPGAGRPGCGTPKQEHTTRTRTTNFSGYRTGSPSDFGLPDPREPTTGIKSAHYRRIKTVGYLSG